MRKHKKTKAQRTSHQKQTQHIIDNGRSSLETKDLDISQDNSQCLHSSSSFPNPDLSIDANSHVDEDVSTLNGKSFVCDNQIQEVTDCDGKSNYLSNGATQTPECDQDLFDVPDRQTGRLALSELNPRRKWNFIEINVTQTELMLQRRDRIHRLIYPLRTVLDDSIGCAVWFAARGAGLAGNRSRQKMCSKARVRF